MKDAPTKFVREESALGTGQRRKLGKYAVKKDAPAKSEREESVRGMGQSKNLQPRGMHQLVPNGGVFIRLEAVVKKTCSQGICTNRIYKGGGCVYHGVLTECSYEGCINKGMDVSSIMR